MRHADPMDQAQDHIEKELAAATAAAAAYIEQQKDRRPAPRGYCLNPDCLEDFPPGDQRLFCDAKCADRHARLLR